MKRGVQRFVPIVFIGIIIVLLVAAAISAVNLFRGGSESQVQPGDTSREELLNTAEGRSVRMTVRGQIVADEQFRSYRISVSPESRDFARYSGYLKKPIASKSYTNNTRAYSEFVNALDRASLMVGGPLIGDADDVTGICAGGVVYEFEMLRGSTVVKRLWTTSCRGIEGSLVASVDQVQKLFHLQIPDVDRYIGRD